MQSRWRGIAILGLALAMVGCSQPPTSSTKGAAPAKPTALRLAVAGGFVYDPHDLTPGYPNVATIRLGDRLRIYAAFDRWTPATLALLDEQKNIIWCARLDLPPGGTVTGEIPESVERATLRLVRSADAFDTSHLEFRIGMIEPEWSTARMKDAGIAQTASTANASGAASNWTSVTVSCESSLDPGVGRVLITTPLSTIFTATSPWSGESPAPDAHWLSEEVRAYLDDYLGSASTQPAEHP